MWNNNNNNKSTILLYFVIASLCCDCLNAAEFGRGANRVDNLWKRLRMMDTFESNHGTFQSPNEHVAESTKTSRILEGFVGFSNSNDETIDTFMSMSLSMSFGPVPVPVPSTPTTTPPSSSSSQPTSASLPFTNAPTTEAVVGGEISAAPSPAPSSMPAVSPFPTAVPTSMGTTRTESPMAMDGNDTALPTDTPTNIATTMPPSIVDPPTFTVGPTSTSSPTSTSPPPSMSSPTSTSTPTMTPTTIFPNNDSPTRAPLVFDCVNNMLSLTSSEVEMMDDDGMVNGTRTNGTDFVSVELSLTVGYQVESTSNDTEDYVLELELRLLETAVLAALGGCSGVDDTGSGGGGRALQYVETMGHRRLTNAETLVVGPCDAFLNETESCNIMETELTFWVLESSLMDVDLAIHAAYTAIQYHMDHDLYIGMIPTVLLLEYLSPLPIPYPGGNETTTTDDAWNGSDTNDDDDDDGNSNPNHQTDPSLATSRLSLSPWTIGACAATVMGGIISLSLWSRNRRRDRLRRHRHHIQLMEEHATRNAMEEGNGIGTGGGSWTIH